MHTMTDTVGTDELTAEDITNLLAGTRDRGGHERFVRKFIAEGAMSWYVNHAASYKGKTKAQLETSVKSGLTNAWKAIEGDKPNVKLVMVEDDLLIINTDVVAERLAAPATEAPAE